jgi:hypothetical protein
MHEAVMHEAVMHDADDPCPVARIWTLLARSTPGFLMLSVGGSLACRSIDACELHPDDGEIWIGGDVQDADLADADALTIVFFQQASRSRFCVTGQVLRGSKSATGTRLACHEAALLSDDGEMLAVIPLRAMAAPEPMAASVA